MSSDTETKGSCLCGAVSVKATLSSKEVGACHCNMCRKWAGGVFLVVECKDQVTFTGEENISVYNSSDWAERAFCAKCGTTLFYRLKENQHHFLASALFDDQSSFKLTHQIFIEEKPSFYTFANETHNMTGEEVFAQFAAEKDE